MQEVNLISIRSDMEKRWREEKYLVMYHSQAHYELIREALKSGCTPARLEQLIEEALDTTPTPGSKTNAFQHMWGYFNKTASKDERDQYARLQQGPVHEREKERINFIRSLAEKYAVGYLLESSILRP